MKRTYAVCAAIGIVLCTIAWLLGIYFGQALFPPPEENGWLHYDDIALDRIGDRLVETDIEVSEQAPLDWGEEFGVLIVPLAKSDQPESSSGDATVAGTAADSAASDQTDVEAQAPAGEWVLADDFGDEAEFHLADGRGFLVSELDIPEPLFYPVELFHWLLQVLAILATVGISVLLIESRLKKLEGATREANLLTEAERVDGPIEAAIVALRRASDHIGKLSHARADESNRHRDLLASVAHEFRNPLARLQFANEMAMDASGAEQQALFSQSNTAAAELDALVRETLSYSRLSAADSVLQLTTVSITDVFRDLASRHLLTAQERGSALPGAVDADTRPVVQLKVDYPEDDLLIRADERLLTRALDNLIGNAIRHAHSRVTLAALPEAEVSGLRISVEDDGPGIEAQHHERIFEPFFRVEASRSRASGGFGLGLSIVKSIIDKHGARVHLESSSSRGKQSSAAGTRFVIDWPELLPQDAA